MTAEPRPISIWQPQWEEGALVFVRPEPGPLGDHYAVRRAITARKPAGQRRICFFGESTAAGYLYAPHLTPAGLLAGILAEVLGETRFEVVDLARTNERLETLVETVEQAEQLDPDLLVVFAGNNWNLLETPELSPYYPSAADRRAYAAAWREGDTWGPIEAAARRRLEKAGAALARIDAMARAAEIPIVLVIPEVNLADWELRQPATWLPAGDSAAWHTAREAATAACAEGAWEEALELCQRMLALDGGTCPTTFSLMARAHRGAGRLELARVAGEAAVNSQHYALMCFLGVPQASVMDQALMRRAARVHGFASVDLPAIFATYSGSPLPGRQLFLDYCHLTAEGMRVAMAAVAAQALNLFADDPGATWQSILAQTTAPALPAEVEATTLLGAAIHTAHRLLPSGSAAADIEAWVEAALAASPDIAATLLDLTTGRAARLPIVLTPAQAHNLDGPYRLGYQHGWRYPHLDAALLAAIVDVLARSGADRAQFLKSLLGSGYAVGPAGIELAHPDCLWEPLARFFPEVMAFGDQTEHAYLRSPWPEMHLALVTEGSRAVALTVTARLPAWAELAPGYDAQLGLTVNEQPLAVLPLSRSWASHRVIVPTTKLKRGLNRLTLRWPPLPAVGTEMLAQALARLEQGLSADIHPVFGELWSAWAETV